MEDNTDGFSILYEFEVSHDLESFESCRRIERYKPVKEKLRWAISRTIIGICEFLASEYDHQLKVFGRSCRRNHCDTIVSGVMRRIVTLQRESSNIDLHSDNERIVVK